MTGKLVIGGKHVADITGGSISWDRPDANPLADVQAMTDLMTRQTVDVAGTFTCEPRAYVEFRLAFMRFGWWPMRFFRRRAARRLLLAEYGLKP